MYYTAIDNKHTSPKARIAQQKLSSYSESHNENAVITGNTACKTGRKKNLPFHGTTSATFASTSQTRP